MSKGPCRLLPLARRRDLALSAGALWLLGGLAGCGTVRIEDPYVNLLGEDGDAADGSAQDAESDSDAEPDTAIDAAVDSSGGVTCTGDEGCGALDSGGCLVGACQSGICVAVALPAAATCVNAGADPRCTGGACDGKGACQATTWPDATPCDADGSPCSVDDVCETGICQPGKPFDCSAGVGPCQLAACTDVAGKATCSVTAVPGGSACEDGSFCTVDTTCDASGTCQGGTPRSCAELSGPCMTASCDELVDACGAKPKAAGLPCNDGKFCTETEACDDKGACATVQLRACPDGPVGSCKVGLCDEGASACALKLAQASTPCDDGDPCTVGESCGATGTCGGAKPKACAGDACNAASCEASTGLCKLLPLQASAPCDDGKACTTKDSCNGAGGCKGGGWDSACVCKEGADCDDGSPCTAESCQDGSCTFAVLGGAPCEDGDPCTTSSLCDASGACIAQTSFDCGGAGTACAFAICEPVASKATCKPIPKGSGTECDDGNPCTAGDACDGKSACAGMPKACTSDKPCSVGSCEAATGACQSTPAPSGATCEDGDACTAGDACDASGACQPGGALPDYSPCDDGAATTAADMCIAKVCAGFHAVAIDGPVVDAAYSPLAKTLLLAAPNKPVTSLDATSEWRIWHAQPNATGAKLSPLAGGGSGSNPPLRSLSALVAGGAKGSLWLAYQSAGQWKWTSSAGNNLATQLNKTVGVGASDVEWVGVGSVAVGNLGHHAFAGWSPTASPATGILAHCSGAISGTGSFTCTATKYASTVRPIAAVASWTKASATAEATPTHDLLALVAKSPGAPFDALQRYRWDATVPTFVGEAILGVPPLTLPPASPVDGSLLRPTQTGVALPGTSALWAVGPSGTIAAQVVGSKGYLAVDALAAEQPTLTPRRIFAVPGGVAIIGERPGKTPGSKVATLLIHRDDPGLQSGKAGWTAFALPVGAECASLQARAGASDGKAIVIGGVGCGGGGSLNGWLLVR